ncbi:MAG: manno-octulosonate cytidylyltransferase [Pseudomonadota bacterium]
MKTLIVIPARYASTRFPQKPLHRIAGKSLLSRVAAIAEAACRDTEDRQFVVATDHESIADHATDLSIPVAMTDPEAPSGTDRALLAMQAYAPETDFVVNLQGDAPFTPPAYIDAVIAAGEKAEQDVVTPVVQLDWDALDTARKQKEVTPFSGTSCVRRADGEAMWFSKTLLPAIRNEAALRARSYLSPVFRHIGLYGYKVEALRRFVALQEGHYEQLEGLEQLRFLENRMRILAIDVPASETAMWGIDTPEDAAHAEALIAKHGEPIA